MLKKTVAFILAAALLISLCSCGLLSGRGGKNTAHEELIAEVRELAAAAAEQYDAGLTFESEYVFGLAQAEISSLRLFIDWLLWLGGEGENITAVIGDAPYRSWEEIIAAGIGSPAPFSFEGLLCRVMGEKERSEELYEKAKYNPLYSERDFRYLRDLSVDELRPIREEAAKLELEIYGVYTPRTVLLAPPTGAEFSPAYHLAMAEEMAEDPKTAAACALNALLASPLTPSLYAGASVYELNAGNAELALEILNDGLFLAPEDASVNYVAALVSHTAGDDASARSFIDTAKAKADGELLENINRLAGQIGG
ncbi:MAG: hypothetical protein J5592_03635 [Clostridia bacterium]|nr:hypothetical protein [Clostridia bacterium]